MRNLGYGRLQKQPARNNFHFVPVMLLVVWSFLYSASQAYVQVQVGRSPKRIYTVSFALLFLMPLRMLSWYFHLSKPMPRRRPYPDGLTFCAKPGVLNYSVRIARHSHTTPSRSSGTRHIIIPAVAV